MKMEKEVRKISKMQAQCSDTKVEVKRHARQIQNRRLTESHKKRHQMINIECYNISTGIPDCPAALKRPRLSQEAAKRDQNKNSKLCALRSRTSKSGRFARTLSPIGFPWHCRSSGTFRSSLSHYADPWRAIARS